MRFFDFLFFLKVLYIRASRYGRSRHPPTNHSFRDCKVYLLALKVAITTLWLFLKRPFTIRFRKHVLQLFFLKIFVSCIYWEKIDLKIRAISKLFNTFNNCLLCSLPFFFSGETISDECFFYLCFLKFGFHRPKGENEAYATKGGGENATTHPQKEDGTQYLPQRRKTNTTPNKAGEKATIGGVAFFPPPLEWRCLSPMYWWCSLPPLLSPFGWIAIWIYNFPPILRQIFRSFSNSFSIFDLRNFAILIFSLVTCLNLEIWIYFARKQFVFHLSDERLWKHCFGSCHFKISMF